MENCFFCNDITFLTNITKIINYYLRDFEKKICTVMRKTVTGFKSNTPWIIEWGITIIVNIYLCVVNLQKSIFFLKKTIGITQFFFSRKLLPNSEKLLFRTPKNCLPKIFLPKNYLAYQKIILFIENLFRVPKYYLPKNYFVYREHFFVIIWIDLR